MCQDSNELKVNRCYMHLPLQFTYYGTGHAIYKDYLYYNQDGSRELIIHSIDKEKHYVKKVEAPEDALCCESDDSNIYNIKNTGFFDFEIDENGLWLIYKRASKNYNINGEDLDFDVYVVAKIDEKSLGSLNIEQKWFVRVEKDSVTNMFIAFGELFALKNTQISPAKLEKLCDMYNDSECSKSYVNESYEIPISTRQITSLSYNPDKKLLYMADGGSFVHYKINKE